MGDRCSRVVVDPWNADLAYVATNWGVYKTANGGTTWTQSLAGHATDILVDPNNPTRLFAGIWNDGVYVSTNAGASWSRSGLGLPVHFKWITFWVGRLPTGTAADWIKLAMGHHGADGTSFLAAEMGPDSGTIYTTTGTGASRGSHSRGATRPRGTTSGRTSSPSSSGRRLSVCRLSTPGSRGGSMHFSRTGKYRRWSSAGRLDLGATTTR